AGKDSDVRTIWKILARVRRELKTEPRAAGGFNVRLYSASAASERSGPRFSVVADSSPSSAACIVCHGRLAHLTRAGRSEEHTSELQSLAYLVCRLLLEKKKKNKK